MKALLKYRRSLWIVVGVLLASAVVLATPPALADDDGGASVVRPTSKKALRTYQELAADWWNWALREPLATNPVVDTTGEFCHVGQEGRVWFLAGTFGGSATRECTVPEGKALFFPIANSVCWYPEDGLTEAKVRECANDLVDPFTVVEASIDGKPVKKLFQKHRVQTPAFVLHLPDGGFLDDIGAFPPGDRFPAVADGYWVLVKPLEEGQHVIRFRGANPDPFGEVIYHLTVVEDEDD